MFLKRINKWKRYKRTYSELSGMSDRDLADIGIRRYQIEEIAREAAATEADKQ